MKSPLLVALLLCLLVYKNVVSADDVTHIYQESEEVVVYTNKIGPIRNSFETYDFFSVPGCYPTQMTSKQPSIGQALAGESLYQFPARVNFGVNITEATVCKYKGKEADMDRWMQMVKEQYSYQFVIDDLPVWATFGTIKDNESMVFLHRSFYFGINNNQIVNVTLKTERPAAIRAGVMYVFTYSVEFSPSTTSFDERFANYYDEDFFQPRIRWFSIINSTLIVCFLIAVVAVIISRTLRADYSKMDEQRRLRYEGHDTLDDSGWKQLYADVFRPPSSPSLFCAVLGSGVQLLTLFASAIVIGALDSLHPSPEHVLITYCVALYAVTSLIAGYVSGSSFIEFTSISPSLSRLWMRCLGLTVILVPILVAVCGVITNSIALLYGSAQAIHLAGVAYIVALWLCVSCPLTLCGTILARYAFRRNEKKMEVPHVNQIPRLIPPPSRKLLSPTPLFLFSGVLPFISIFIELYLVFSSIWLYKLYYLYGFLEMTCAIYVIVTGCTSVAATFALLSSENHLWRWRSVSFGASCSLYVFLYSVYFYVFKTRMSGFYMFMFYFSYSIAFCVLLACVGGSIAYFAASMFVNRIYVRVKGD